MQFQKKEIASHWMQNKKNKMNLFTLKFECDFFPFGEIKRGFLWI
jgi:hypothetical protein